MSALGILVSNHLASLQLGKLLTGRRSYAVWNGGEVLGETLVMRSNFSMTVESSVKGRDR